MDRIADASRDTGQVIKINLLGSLISVLPALSPIIGSTAGGIMALASSLTAAGAAAGGYGLVAVPALTGVFKAQEKLTAAQEAVASAEGPEEKAEALAQLKKVQDGLTKSQLASLEAMKKFGSFFSKFAKRFEAPILDQFNRSLGILQQLMETTWPVIDGAVRAVDDLIDAFERNLKADDVKAIFYWLNTSAGPALETIGKAIGNFLTGTLSMLAAFNPLAVDMQNGLLGMSEGFRDWAASLSESKKFEDFLNFVRENGPKVLDLIGNLTMFIINLGIGLAPVGTKILDITNAFLEWTNKMMETYPVVGTIIGVAMSLFGVLMTLIPGIALTRAAFKGLGGGVAGAVGKIISWMAPFKTQIIAAMRVGGGALLRFLGGPVGLLVQGVVALVILIVKNWDEIAAFTKRTWENISGTMRAAWSYIRNKAGELVAKVVLKFLELKSNVVNTFNAIRDYATQKAGELVGKVVGKFLDLKNRVTDKMESVQSKITDIWGDVMDFFGGIDLADTGRNIMEGLLNGITGMAGKLMDKAASIASSIKDTIKGALRIHSPSRETTYLGKMVGAGLAEGMTNSLRSIKRASNTLAFAAVPAVPQASGIRSGYKTSKVRPDYSYRYGGSRSERNRDESKPNGITQQITINSTQPLSPAETARKYRQAARHLAMEWHV
ncbi:phage tail protein [Thalassobacillus hwangdonensis]|uniref:Phage-related protein n=1 Tax=Thalassobacillus hwangdonensis TaxID=546108 RepID=A0ABW3L0G2_9BACI